MQTVQNSVTAYHKWPLSSVSIRNVGCVAWTTTQGKLHEMLDQIKPFAIYSYTYCRITYVLVYGNTMYEFLSQWVYLCRIKSSFCEILAYIDVFQHSKISWGVATYVEI